MWPRPIGGTRLNFLQRFERSSDKSKEMQHDKKPEPQLSRIRRFANFCEAQVLAFARDSVRPANELTFSMVRRFWFEAVFAFAIIMFFSSTYGPAIRFQVSRWQSYSAEVELQLSRWKVLFESKGNCEERLEESCDGNLTHGALWSSNQTLADTTFQSKVKSFRGKSFWIGLEISPQELIKAKSNGASTLGLGMFNSAYKVYLNDALVDSGSGRDILPVSIHLPLELFEKNHPVRIAIQIDHNLGSRMPVWFNTERMSGLFKPDSAKAMLGFWTFVIGYEPILMSASSLLFGLFFLMMWLSVPKKAEYFYFSFYLITFSMIAVVPFAPIAQGSFRPKFYEGEFWLAAIEGVLGGLIGISYSRARKVYFVFPVVIGFFVSGSIYLTVSDALEFYWYKDFLVKFFTPIMLAVGAFFCFSQKLLLGQKIAEGLNGVMLKARQKRLMMFGLLLLMTGISIAISRDLSGEWGFFSRTVKLVLIGMLGISLFWEYREREQQFEVIQRSPFHNPFGGVSSEVFGFLVSLDLVGSSAFANFSASNKSSVRPITIWNAHIGRVMHKNGGFKIADEGDGLKVFFNLPNTESNLEKVVETLLIAEKETKLIIEELHRTSVVPPELIMKFRSSVVWGGLNPIWKDFVGVKTPEWEDAKGATTLKDSQRIMDVEKTFSRQEWLDSVSVIDTSFELGKIQVKQRKRLNCHVKDVGETSLLILELSAPGAKARRVS